MNVISELPAISPGADKILKYKQENEDMLMLINSSLERLQLFNLNKRLIVMDSIIHKKNFISSTEVEQINNRRLMNVEVARPSNDYIATYEEIKDEADPNFLISMLKFWKFTNYTLELLCVADNPHKNERVKQIRSSNSMFLTIGESSFKVWKLTEKKFNCIFTGSYRRDNVTDVIFTSETKCISLHGGCRLVEWDLSTKKFTRIHFLPQVYSKMLYFDEEQTILLYDEKTICALKNWELIWFEEFKEHSINKVTYESKEDFLLYLQKDKSKDEVIIYKTSIANKKINQCFFVRKFNLSYIDSWNGSKFVIANTKRDLFITGKKNYYLTKEKEWNVRNSFDLELPKVRIDIKENLESSSKTRTFKSISGGDIFEQNLDSLKLKK